MKNTRAKRQQQERLLDRAIEALAGPRPEPVKVDEAAMLRRLIALPTTSNRERARAERDIERIEQRDRIRAALDAAKEG